MTEKEILQRKIEILKASYNDPEKAREILKEYQEQNEDLCNPNFSDREKEDGKNK